eukprot:582697-Rhodomonas_salina.1
METWSDTVGVPFVEKRVFFAIDSTAWQVKRRSKTKIIYYYPSKISSRICVEEAAIVTVLEVEQVQLSVDIPSVTMTSSRRMHLCDLHGQLIAELWPAEMVVAGTRVCKTLRMHLCQCAENITLRSAPEGQDWQFSALGQLQTGIKKCKSEICVDLRRFEAARSLELDVDSCKIQIVPILAGLKAAQKAGWGGRLYALSLSCSSESSEAEQELGRVLQPSVLGQHTQLQALDLSGN